MAATVNEAPPSLDDEMLSSLRQTHALELSAAQSRIRSLESAIFDAEARAHELQKQVTILEDQRPAVFTPSPVPSRPSSRGAAAAIIPPRSRVIEQNLSAETRHKRTVSLSMLKARIEREGGGGGANGRLSPVMSVSSLHSHDVGEHHHARPQFLDDSQVFWCASCRGDLVIL